jgi:hypothetical protein
MKTLSYIRKKAAITPSFCRFWILFSVAVTALYFMVSSSSAYAGQVTLSWDKGTEPDVAGYKIYFGLSSRNYTKTIKITSPDITTCTILNLTEGQRYYFAATTYNAELLESDYSTEVFTAIKSIRVIWPNGGQVWKIGTIKNIKWIAATAITNNLRIVLFKGGLKVGTIVDSIDPAIGTYAWKVGQYAGGTAAEGSDYFIQIREIGTDAGDRSDDFFTLTAP